MTNDPLPTDSASPLPPEEPSPLPVAPLPAVAPPLPDHIPLPGELPEAPLPVPPVPAAPLSVEPSSATPLPAVSQPLPADLPLPGEIVPRKSPPPEPEAPSSPLRLTSEIPSGDRPGAAPPSTVGTLPLVDAARAAAAVPLGAASTPVGIAPQSAPDASFAPPPVPGPLPGDGRISMSLIRCGMMAAASLMLICAMYYDYLMNAYYAYHRREALIALIISSAAATLCLAGIMRCADEVLDLSPHWGWRVLFIPVKRLILVLQLVTTAAALASAGGVIFKMDIPGTSSWLYLPPLQAIPPDPKPSQPANGSAAPFSVPPTARANVPPTPAPATPTQASPAITQPTAPTEVPPPPG